METRHDSYDYMLWFAFALLLDMSCIKFISCSDRNASSSSIGDQHRTTINRTLIISYLWSGVFDLVMFFEDISSFINSFSKQTRRTNGQHFNVYLSMRFRVMEVKGTNLGGSVIILIKTGDIQLTAFTGIDKRCFFCADPWRLWRERSSEAETSHWWRNKRPLNTEQRRI